MNELLLRRRGMMLKKLDELAHFVQGIYYGGSSSSNTVNSDGSITSNSRLLYFTTIPFTKQIQYNSGDIITLAQDRNYTSLTYFRTIRLNNSSGKVIVNNKLMGSYASFSITADEDGEITGLYFGNSSGVQTGTVKPILLINNVQVLG